MINDSAAPRIIGHCLITDADTGEILADKINAINYESMSYVIALSLSGQPNGTIMQMLFGNGASSISGGGTITYLAPNVSGVGATLYNQTYAKFVNDQSPTDTAPTDNFIEVFHATNTTYSDVVVTCLLDYSEPSGQEALDAATAVSGTYIFDEIGLATYNPSTSTGYMISHVIFHPVHKALSRKIQVRYSLRIVMA